MEKEIINDKNEEFSGKGRFYIIISLILTALIIGLPSWYLTTSVERYSLPIEEMNLLNDKYLNNIKYNIPVQLIELTNPLEGFVDEVQNLLNEKLVNSNVGIKLIGDNDDDDNIYNSTCKVKLIVNEDDDKIVISPYKDRLLKLFITPEIIKNGLVSDLLVRVLTENIFNFEISGDGLNYNNKIQLPFSSHYKISINFLHSSDKILNLKDDKIIFKAIKNFQKFLNSISSIAKFTLEFQELWYEERLITTDEYRIDNITYIKDTSMFIDYSDWGLDQNVELEPVINLNLYLPDEETLIIENSIKNSFIIPQWGGVIILNNNEEEIVDYEKLNEIFEIFAFQLLKLIGIETDLDSSSLFLKIDEIIRIQTIKNLNNSLKNFKNLIKLINQLDTIPIPLQSVNEIKESIEFLNNSIENLNNLNWLDAYKYSISALELSNNAFFHKDMVQQAHFPEEHKMAVYSPLLGPFITILTLALLRGIKEIKNN